MPTDARAAERRAPDGRRALLLGVLRVSPGPRSIAQLADELGVHPNTVRFHVDALESEGRIERVLGPASGPGRPPVGYRLPTGMDRHGPTNYRLLAAMLTGHLEASTGDPGQAATEAGRAWGPGLLAPPTRSASASATARMSKAKAVSRVVDVLADLGFEPEPPPPRPVEIRLRHCPFIDLVDDHAEVVCSLHLGLMQGAFTALRSAVTVDRLVPFAQPDLCIAHLASAGLPA